MLLTLAILFPLLSASVVACLRKAKRPVLLVLSVILQIFTSALLIAVTLLPRDTLTLFHISDKIEVAFCSDGIAKLFCVLIAIGWMLAILYSSVYMKQKKSEPRFYTYIFLSEAAIVGATLSSELVTMFVFCVLLTLTSLPLISHDSSRESIRAANKYLVYSICGFALALFGIFVLLGAAAPLTFTSGGVGLVPSTLTLSAILCSVLGYGTMAGLYPLHGGIMAAIPKSPIPASLLLTALIPKAGVLAIIRTVYFVADPKLLKGTWVQTVLLVFTLISILAGVALSHSERCLKKRLAHLTVSRVSCALIGLFLFTELGLKGAVLQIVFHAAAKTVLLLFAGAVISLVGATETNALYGVGRRLPIVTSAFTVASLSLIGIPPTGGFLSTFTLATAALDGLSAPFSYIVPAVLLLSALLTAGSLLSISVHAFYPGEKINPAFIEPKTKKEPILLVLPAVLLAVFSLLCGIPMGVDLGIADLIVGTIM